MAYAGVDEAKLYWEESGSGPPLLLIQGLGFSAMMWHRLIPLLETRLRVIRYDARGIGRSDVPPGPYPIELMADDAAAVLSAAEVDVAHVFGCSLGGIVAQELALTHSDRVRSLQLCCTHPAGEAAVWPSPEVMEMLTTRTSLPREEAIRASIPVAYADDVDPDVIEGDIRLRLELPTTDDGYTNQLTGGLGYPGTADRLPALDIPVLVMTGDADRLVPPANTEILARLIPGATTRYYSGGGHVVFSEQPAAVAAAMLEFLDRIEAADAGR